MQRWRSFSMRTGAERGKAGPSRRDVTALLLAAPLVVAATRPPAVDDEALRQAYAFTFGLG